MRPNDVVNLRNSEIIDSRRALRVLLTERVGTRYYPIVLKPTSSGLIISYSSFFGLPVINSDSSQNVGNKSRDWLADQAKKAKTSRFEHE